MKTVRRPWLVLTLLLALAAIFLFIRAGRIDSRTTDEAAVAPVDPAPAVVAASAVSPRELLSDAPSMTGTMNRASTAEAEGPAGEALSAATSAPPRVAVSRIFAPYGAPAAMISRSAGGATNVSMASPAFLEFKKWSEVQAAGSGTAYLNLTAMLGTAPTGEIARSTWIEVPAAGSITGTTGVSAVLAMITEKPGDRADNDVVTERSASDPDAFARVMYYVREGDAKMSQGLLEEAAKAYADALAIYPQLTYANQQVGRLNLVLGNYEAAIRNLQAALEATDDIGETLNDLGVAYMYAGRLNEALETFDASLQAEPEQLDPVFNTGLALRQSGQFVEARRQFEKYLNIIPRDARAMRELAVIDMLENQRETALRRLIIAIEYDDTWATPMLDAALLFAEMGINDRALALMERALDRASVREVYQVYMQDPFRNIRLSPEGKPFEAKLAAKARAGK